MSCCGGKSRHPPDPKGQARNDILNGQMNQWKIDQNRILKLLLLGPGESGKSTVFKQVNALFNKGYPEEERKRFRTIVFNNLYIGMRILTSESEKLSQEGFRTGIATNDAEIAKEIVEKIDYHDDLTPQIAQQLQVLWDDRGIQETWQLRSKYQCPYPLDYFMAKLPALVKTDYIPSQEDILRCRVRTTGIVELEFTIDPNKFVIIDVGGQRNERKKWIHCFNEVTAVIFVAAVSEYDQVLYEDQKTNRLHEAVDLFSELSGLKTFHDTSIILFLNKIDLFSAKMKEIPLTACFPDYGGSSDEKIALNFIKEKFLSRASRGKKIFTHFTCATDSEMIRNVLMDVRDIILRKDFDSTDVVL
eukprot:TRINITY_DN4724_c0_g1_i1.p1 TRINITY_DN4724_c0_g1~~TRINITY_DN4724_c0_g1_i1.p1  ORF type:complete len:360 (-),score=70.09 TRINITY_DN4724_c0_g1_i1:124-1203(-)